MERFFYVRPYRFTPVGMQINTPYPSGSRRPVWDTGRSSTPWEVMFRGVGQVNGVVMGRPRTLPAEVVAPIVPARPRGRNALEQIN